MQYIYIYTYMCVYVWKYIHLQTSATGYQREKLGALEKVTIYHLYIYMDYIMVLWCNIGGTTARVHPERLTWNRKTTQLKKKIIFQTSMTLGSMFIFFQGVPFKGYLEFPPYASRARPVSTFNAGPESSWFAGLWWFRSCGAGGTQHHQRDICLEGRPSFPKNI